MDEHELKELCAYWQKVLRLQDWDVNIKIARVFEMHEDGIGEINMVMSLKKAFIQILDTNDSAPDEDKDIELTLVHELVHLHLAEWSEQESGMPVSGEQAVDLLAKALVQLKRSAESSKEPKKC